MTSFTLVIAVTAFLAGAAAAAFIMIVIGIRRVGHPRMPRSANTPLDVFTRTTLGTRTWPNGAGLDDRHTE